jgi:hypothetical protein
MSAILSIRSMLGAAPARAACLGDIGAAGRRIRGGAGR